MKFYLLAIVMLIAVVSVVLAAPESLVSDDSCPPGTIRVGDECRRLKSHGSTECSPAADGMKRFACPTPDRQGHYRCIDDRVLCDGFIDCPSGEDEDRKACMFYKATKDQLDVLADALLRWATPAKNPSRTLTL